MLFVLFFCVIIQIFRQIHCPPPQRGKIQRPEVAPKPKALIPKPPREPFVEEEQIRAKLESLKRVPTDKPKILAPKPQREFYTEEESFEVKPNLLRRMHARTGLVDPKQRESYVEKLPTQTKPMSMKETGALQSLVDTPQSLSYMEQFPIEEEQELPHRRIAPQTRDLVADPNLKTSNEEPPKVIFRKVQRRDGNRRSVDILQPEPFTETEQIKEKRKSLYDITAPQTQLLVGEPEPHYYNDERQREEIRKSLIGQAPPKPKRKVSTAEPEAYSEQHKKEKRKLLETMGQKVHELYNEYVAKIKNLQKNTDVEENALRNGYKEKLEILRSEYPEGNPEDINEYRSREEKLKNHLAQEWDLLEASSKQVLDELKAETESKTTKIAEKFAEEINRLNDKLEIITFKRRANVFTKDIQQELSKISEFDASWPNTEHVYEVYEGLKKAAETYTHADENLYAKSPEELFKILFIWLFEKRHVENPTFGHYPCSAEQFQRRLLGYCVLMRSAMDSLTKYERESIIGRYPYEK